MFQETMRAAQNVARHRGWAVFPVLESKRPACKKWPELAAFEPDAVTELWQRYPAPLIGIAMGSRSGIDLLDIDVKHEDALAWWDANRGRLTPTLSFRTRSGGIHCYYQHAPEVRNSQGRIAPGIDVRGDGGFAVFWFAAGFSCLWDMLPAAWPAWLLRPGLLFPEPSAPRTAYRASSTRYGGASDVLEALLSTVSDAREGSRNGTLFWAANRAREHVLEGDVSQGEAETLLLEAARAAGLKDYEAKRTIDSAFRR